MEEVLEVVEAKQRVLDEQDKQQAHYASLNLAAQGVKKSDRDPEKIRFIQPKKVQHGKGGEEREKPKVVSMEERRQAREAIAAARERVPWSSGKSGKKSS